MLFFQPCECYWRGLLRLERNKLLLPDTDLGLVQRCPVTLPIIVLLRGGVMCALHNDCQASECE